MASVLLATVLSACSSDEPSTESGSEPSAGASESGSGDSGDSGATPSESPSATTTPYLDVPDGVELTEPGSQLGLGDEATVAYRPTQKLTGVLDVTVSSIERTSFAESFEGWEVDDAKDKSPFFVRATVRNVGDTDLDGRPVPLYAATDRNTLIEPSSFSHEFEPCRPGRLPDPFAQKGTVDVCLVYLVPKGTKLTAVTFRPTEDFLPITWSGRITGVGEKPKQGKDKAKNSATPEPTESAQ